MFGFSAGIVWFGEHQPGAAKWLERSLYKSSNVW